VPNVRRIPNMRLLSNRIKKVLTSNEHVANFSCKKETAFFHWAGQSSEELIVKRKREHCFHRFPLTLLLISSTLQEVNMGYEFVCTVLDSDNLALTRAVLALVTLNKRKNEWDLDILVSWYVMCQLRYKLHSHCYAISLLRCWISAQVNMCAQFHFVIVKLFQYSMTIQSESHIRHLSSPVRKRRTYLHLRACLYRPLYRHTYPHPRQYSYI
jgi:hypothetical protein